MPPSLSNTVGYTGGQMETPLAINSAKHLNFDLSQGNAMHSHPKPSVVVFAKDIVGLAKFYMQVAGLQELQRDDGHDPEGNVFQVRETATSART